MTDLETLTPEECWRLLGKRVVGRVGFDMGHGPRIHPVNYRVDGRSVVLRTSEDAELTRFVEMFADGSLIAFEVIEGRIERVDAPEELHRLHDVWPRPWVSGTRDVVARVTPGEVTGRRLGPDSTL